MTLAVAFGAALGLWHLRATEGTSRPPVSVGIVHGLIGAAGLVVLLLSLRGPPRGVAAGAESFGKVAAVIFGAALLTGLAVLLRRRKVPAVTMAIHSGLAITAYVLLLAWDIVG